MKKDNKIYNFPVIIEKDEDGWYIGKVTSLKGCHTQAKTIPELYERLNEVVSLCLGAEEELCHEKVSPNKFVGVYNLEFAQ